MKRVAYLVFTILAMASCSKIEIADDPILGVWTHNLETPMEAEGIAIDAQEWIFNDLFKGRFHGYKDGKIVYDMDYRWSFDNEGYTLKYNGGDLNEIRFKLQDNLLIDMNDNVVASRAK